MASTMEVAFAHHVWANLRLLDACADLDGEQLEAGVPGVYGTLIDTLRHVVGGDASYLHLLTDGEVDEIDEAAMGIAQLRAVAAAHGEAWRSLIGSSRDGDAAVVRHRDDGSTSSAPFGVRMAQVPHHGTDHRSQVCTILTTLGIEPPSIDVWDWAWEQGLLEETPATDGTDG